MSLLDLYSSEDIKFPCATYEDCEFTKLQKCSSLFCCIYFAVNFNKMPIACCENVCRHQRKMEILLTSSNSTNDLSGIKFPIVNLQKSCRENFTSTHVGQSGNQSHL